MLVLGQRQGQKILIGEDIVITTVRIGSDNVRLGIDAPRGVAIVREELTIPPHPHALNDDGGPTPEDMGLGDQTEAGRCPANHLSK